MKITCKKFKKYADIEVIDAPLMLGLHCQMTRCTGCWYGKELNEK